MTPPPVHVVAAALIDAAGRILIQRRADKAHQGGLWEFPGGKLEPGESREHGLQRELDEELGIRALNARPLIAVHHDYGDRRVLLDVWRVSDWHGHPRDREGQPLVWTAIDELARYEFPAADRPVLRALALPSMCLVTPEPGVRDAPWLDALHAAVAAGVRLVQVRTTTLAPERAHAIAAAAVTRCRAVNAAVRVVVNADPVQAFACGAAGVHLNSTRLWQHRRRPLAANRLLGVSCHNAADLAQAAVLDADYALLGPVQPTATHPHAEPMGWDTFTELCAQARLPVYALGGLGEADLATAQQSGAQGIAAIRGLWPAQVPA